jgi:hypothetical protein
MRIGALRAAVAAVAACSMCATAPAQAGAIAREGFAFPTDKPVKIVVFRPDVQVGSLKIGGLDEPNAEWTATARNNLQHALEAQAKKMDSSLVVLDELDGSHAEVLSQYRGLFEAVAASMFAHVTVGDRLPTKLAEVNGKRKVALDWTLGEGARQLKDATGADYAMFVFTHDAYGDASRKAAQALGMLGCIVGACVLVSAGVHIGYSGLVDLETGNIVWFNTDLAMGGDPREVDGAEKRVSQLLAGFPARPAATVAAAR